ncbi:sensor histidine kinase [Janibacter sp. G56]|uniref:sensor histidine kinase n=1 Tax=Janibacter sp. G56 TaxID=3418717 RepID=UPI003D053CE1
MVDERSAQRLLVQVTQSALLVRLAALLATLVATLGQPMTLTTLVGIVAAGLTSYVGLSRPELLRMITRHPSLALGDLVIIGAAMALAGPDSPFALVLLSTALLLGLWVQLLPGIIVIVPLLALYVFSLTKGEVPQAGNFITVGLVPFVYVTLWYLGLTVRSVVEAEAQARKVVLDAIASNAALGERTAVARELHDSVAKTVQGIALTAASLPAQLKRDPEAGAARVRDVQGMATQAVHELRTVMGSLRERSSDEDLSVALTQLVLAWGETASQHLSADIAPGVDTHDEAVRYELLTCTREALDNVRRHAGPCEVEVSLSVETDREVVVVIRDTGKGFAHGSLEAAEGAGHYGISGLRERMARIGGVADVTSEVGNGTTVTLRVHPEGLVER